MRPQKQNLPDLICYIVTSKCLANCDICISDINVPDLPTKKAKQVISNIVKAGAKVVSFAGREPFLRKDIFELIEHTKGLEAKLNIETGGATLNDNVFTELSKYKLDWMAISIDSLDKQLCSEMGRPYLSKSHINYVVKSCNQYKINLKINSVVSQVSREEIADIGKLLVNNSPRIWKLRQFTPRSSGYKVRDKYQISEGDFLQIVEKTKREFPSLKIEGKTSAQQSGTAFMIFPDGQIAKPEGKGHILYGNVLEKNLNEVWNEQFASQKKKFHHRNFDATYK